MMNILVPDQPNHRPVRPVRHAAIWLLFALLGTSIGGGCAGVEPYQRAVFGTYTMRADRDPLDNVFREHIHFTREAATGGTGVGGGGCGCN